jgi:Ras GTPase-activating-like protein IQGAP2/3
MQQMSKGKNKKKTFSLFRAKTVKEDGWVVGRSVKYTASKLKEKGVLISADVAESQLKLVTIEIIAQDDPGCFDVNATSMGIKLEKMELQLQDLLQMQYENIPTMKMFDMCLVSVNLMIFLINKKFYGK